MNERKREEVVRLLSMEPMTRSELERRTGLQQQRVSEVLREIGAQVVGHQATGRKGHPAPIYAMSAEQCVHHSFDALTQAWGWRPV